MPNGPSDAFFWEWYQTRRIQDVHRDLVQTKRESRREDEILRARSDKALLACQAVWTLMRDKLGLTDEDLLARVKALDLTDGRLDGKVRQELTTCAACQREVTRRYHHCIYCGEEIVADPFHA